MARSRRRRNLGSRGAPPHRLGAVREAVEVRPIRDAVASPEVLQLLRRGAVSATAILVALLLLLRMRRLERRIPPHDGAPAAEEVRAAFPWRG